MILKHQPLVDLCTCFSTPRVLHFSAFHFLLGGVPNALKFPCEKLNVVNCGSLDSCLCLSLQDLLMDTSAGNLNQHFMNTVICFYFILNNFEQKTFVPKNFRTHQSRTKIFPFVIISTVPIGWLIITNVNGTHSNARVKMDKFDRTTSFLLPTVLFEHFVWRKQFAVRTKWQLERHSRFMFRGITRHLWLAHSYKPEKEHLQSKSFHLMYRTFVYSLWLLTL